MSIASTARRIQYTGNGVTTVFAFPYYFPASTDLSVVLTTAGLDTIKSYPVDFSVAGAGNPAGGSVTMAVAPANGVKVTVYSAIPETQPQQYVVDDNFPAVSHERALDRATALIQQLRTEMDRSMRVPMSSGVQGTLGLAARTGKVLGFDANGDVTLYAFVGGIISPQSVQGAVNQVLVNGVSGVPTTGAVTLALPQDIATNSSVRFGRIGINSDATVNTDIFITRSLPVNTAQASVTVTGGLYPGIGVDLHPNAFRDTTTFVPVVAGDAYTCYDAQATVAGAVDLNHYHGYQCRNGFIGSGTLGILSGFATTNMGLNGVGTVTFMRGLYISQATIAGGGSVGQFDGIYMDNLVNGTGLVNAIYIAGPNRVFMAGGQIVTSQDLTPPAGATTARGAFTFDQATQTGLAVMNRNATATGTMISFCRDGGSVQGSITQVNNTTVAYNTSSDLRLKENVRDMTDSGAIIDALHPKIFDWKWAKKKNRGTNGGKFATGTHGLIAQEVYLVYPEAVTVGDDELDTDGNPIHPWGMDNSKFSPVILAELKDIRRRLAAAGIAA